MRNLINLVEDPALKKQIIQVVKDTDDLNVLHKVLNTLKAGNIDERIQNVIGKDADAQQFIKKIISAIMEIEAPVEEKNAFLEKYAKGQVLDTGKLLDGKLHSFADVCGPGFTLELFKRLSIELVSQGVGPGEVALAVLSPEIQWSGRTAGGGDVQIRKKPVEVKARVSKGGRWINARKAKLDLGGIFTAISNALRSSRSDIKLPDRINANFWVDTIRPALTPKLVKPLAKTVADGTFKFADNKPYQTALATGDASSIVNSFLSVGYDNYKAYSKFAGMLLMDVPTEQLKYYVDYADMAGDISVSTTYLLAPESEMMPQVILAPGSGPIRAGAFKSSPTDLQTTGGTKAATKKKIEEYAKKICSHYSITDVNFIKRVAQVIETDLSMGISPDKIPLRLAKVFPELNPRKPKQEVAKGLPYDQPDDEAEPTQGTERPISPPRQRR